MNDTASSGAPPSTIELYCGAPLYDNSVRSDLLATLARTFKVFGSTQALRTISCLNHVVDRAFADVLVRLHDAVKDRAASREDVVHALRRASLILNEILDEGRYLVDGRDFAARLLIYRLELCDDTVLKAARETAAFTVREQTTDPHAADLLLGLSLTTQHSPQVWSTREGDVRLIVAALGRQAMRPAARNSVPDGWHPDVQAIMDEEDDPANYELRGIARNRPPSLRKMVVVPSWPANSARKNDGARAEAGGIAGRELPLVPVPADLGQVSAGLGKVYPNAKPIIAAVERSQVGRSWIKFPNLLIHGPAGTGKSEFSQALGRAYALHTVVYNAAGAHDATYSGTSRQWHSARTSVSLGALIAAQAANALVVIDEADKVGIGTHQGRLWEALLPFLEQSTSSAILDPGLEVQVDLSQVSYVVTANSLDPFPRPFLDRFTVIEMPEPEFEQIGDLAKAIVERLRQERQTTSDWLPDLAPEEVEMLTAGYRKCSIRRLRKMVEMIVDSRDDFAIRH